MFADIVLALFESGKLNPSRVVQAARNEANDDPADSQHLITSFIKSIANSPASSDLLNILTDALAILLDEDF